MTAEEAKVKWSVQCDWGGPCGGIPIILAHKRPSLWKEMQKLRTGWFAMGLQFSSITSHIRREADGDVPKKKQMVMQIKYITTHNYILIRNQAGDKGISLRDATMDGY